MYIPFAKSSKFICAFSEKPFCSNTFFPVKECKTIFVLFNSNPKPFKDTFSIFETGFGYKLSFINSSETDKLERSSKIWTSANERKFVLLSWIFTILPVAPPAFTVKDSSWTVVIT